MSNKLTIVTEGGKNLGFGHITRCIAIAIAFEKKGYIVNFHINGDQSINNTMHLKNYVFKNYNWTIEFNKLLSTIKGSSIILIDSMQISNKQLLQLEDTLIPIIFIDDEKRRNILNKGFVIDWTVLSEEENYFNPKKEHITYLLGSKYTPLREDFTHAKRNIIRENIETILITFGGSDIRNLTPCILKLLIDKYPNVKKNIVIGGGFDNIDNIKKYEDDRVNLIYEPSTLKMIQLMQESDIAISSGGQTLYELVRIGTPTIAILLVENAKDDTVGWNKVGSIKSIGWWNDIKLNSNLIHALSELQSRTKRISMKSKGENYISPNSSEYLVNRILENLK